MNPHTILTPILGVYMMKINRDGATIPLYFILQRSIQEFDYSTLEDDDLTFGFDIKG
jgi:hypothetical protein